MAFSATSAFTLLAITVGYLVHANPDGGSGSLLNSLDIYTIQRCKVLFRLKKGNSAALKSQRCSALEHFVLELSDQQIVTGLPILNVACTSHCSMSSYHFFIIVTLVRFSSTTHLSTLTVLQNYFEGFPKPKYIRLIGMSTIYTHPQLPDGYFAFSLHTPSQC